MPNDAEAERAAPIDRYGFFDRTDLPQSYPEIFRRALAKRRPSGEKQWMT